MFLWSFTWLVVSSRGGRHSSCEGSDSTETSWLGLQKKMHRRNSAVKKNLFLTWGEPITNCKADPAVMESCGGFWVTWTSGHCYVNVTFSATTQHRCIKVPVPIGTGRRFLFAWSSAQAVKRASTSQHKQWGEQLPTMPQMPACSEACVLQPRVTLPTAHALCTMLLLTHTANYPHLSSTGNFPKRKENQREKMKITSFLFQRKQSFSQSPN